MDEDVCAVHVLLVEDEVFLSDMVSDVLACHGFEVHTVTNAEDALTHLRNGAPCDLLFTDINLAGPTDGVLLAQAARRLRPELPVIYTSGTVAGSELCAVPGSAFLPKPYNPDTLCAFLRDHAAKARPPLRASA
jgi:DNA-binding NtrC family response regulator